MAIKLHVVAIGLPGNLDNFVDSISGDWWWSIGLPNGGDSDYTIQIKLRRRRIEKSRESTGDHSHYARKLFVVFVVVIVVVCLNQLTTVNEITAKKKLLCRQKTV